MGYTWNTKTCLQLTRKRRILDQILDQIRQREFSQHNSTTTCNNVTSSNGALRNWPATHLRVGSFFFFLFFSFYLNTHGRKHTRELIWMPIHSQTVKSSAWLMSNPISDLGPLATVLKLFKQRGLSLKNKTLPMSDKHSTDQRLCIRKVFHLAIETRRLALHLSIASNRRLWRALVR